MKSILIVIGMILLAIWAIGFFFKLVGAVVHLALVLALIFLGISFFKKPYDKQSR